MTTNDAVAWFVFLWNLLQNLLIIFKTLVVLFFIECTCSFISFFLYLYVYIYLLNKRATCITNLLYYLMPHTTTFNLFFFCLFFLFVIILYVEFLNCYCMWLVCFFLVSKFRGSVTRKVYQIPNLFLVFL